MLPRVRPFRPSGSSVTPAVIIVGALAVSAAVFFVFTRPAMQNQQAKATSAVPAGSVATPSGQVASGPSPATGGTTPATGSQPGMLPPREPGAIPAGSVPGAPASPTPTVFGKADDLGMAVARALADGDVAAAVALTTSGGDASQQKQAAAVFDHLTKSMGIKIGPLDKVQILGQAGDATRITIPLTKPGQTGSGLEMQLDIVRDAQSGWKVAQVHLPKELEAALAAAAATATSTPSGSPAMTAATGNAPGGSVGAGSPAGAAAAPAPGAPPPGSVSPEMVRKASPLFAIEENPDPLSVAHVFVQALLNQDYVTAQRMTDSARLPNQKLAGLSIVFEEGEYSLRAGKPLVMTVASPLDAWVIAQVKSDKLQQTTEFGLEMQRQDGKEWRITALNLSDLLGSFARSATTLGVPYTPLVKNPQGGESLALYFEYDQAELHERARKQLEIVANLLKANPSRKLRIAGHTDAKGTDDYNLNLSRRRAQSVKLQLAALGVAPDQVVTEAMGKTAPISPNQKADGTDDPEGRSRNRRAEIYLDF